MRMFHAEKPTFAMATVLILALGIGGAAPARIQKMKVSARSFTQLAHTRIIKNLLFETSATDTATFAASSQGELTYFKLTLGQKIT